MGPIQESPAARKPKKWESLPLSALAARPEPPSPSPSSRLHRSPQAARPVRLRFRPPASPPPVRPASGSPAPPVLLTSPTPAGASPSPPRPAPPQRQRQRQRSSTSTKDRAPADRRAAASGADHCSTHAPRPAVLAPSALQFQQASKISH